MKKVFSFLSLIICFAFILGGCASGNELNLKKTSDRIIDYYVNNYYQPVVKAYAKTKDFLPLDIISTAGDKTNIAGFISMDENQFKFELMAISVVDYYASTTREGIYEITNPITAEFYELEISSTYKINLTITNNGTKTKEEHQYKIKMQGDVFIVERVLSGADVSIFKINYNKDGGHLDLEITEKIGLVRLDYTKKFYHLEENILVFRTNYEKTTSTGTKSYFNIEGYSKNFGFKLKIAKCKANANQIEIRNQPLNSIAVEQTNDIGGYYIIFIEKTIGTSTDIVSFGSNEAW